MNLVELSVLVPEERVTEFYVMLGNWLAGSAATAGGGEATATAAESETGRKQGRRSRRGGRAASSSRYAGIGDLLKGKSGSTTEASFTEIEGAIGNTLPASAERHRAWWANTERNTQARVWMEEGWRVDQVDFDERKVTFSRI